jgi:uncharacterized protein YjdB
LRPLPYCPCACLVVFSCWKQVKLNLEKGERMRKLYRSLLAVGAVTGIVACGDDVTVQAPPEQPPPTVTAVTVQGPATLRVGESAVFSASVTTNGAGVNTAVTWSSANAAIASVNATGTVTGVAPGSTTIRATSVANSGVSGAAPVTVVPNVVRSVSVTPTSASLVVGQTLTAVANVDRDPGVAGTVTWSSSNTAVATVGSTSGVITAVAPGTAVITATSTADASKSASLSVTVTPQPNALTSLSVSPTSLALGINDTQVLTTIHQAACTNVTYANSSSNPAVATVTASGANPTVTAVANGTAVITVQATATCAGFQTNSLAATVTVSVQGPQISINAINKGGLPVNLNNVTGQIDVVLNFDPGNSGIDSVVVRMRRGTTFKTAAKQNFGGTRPAAGLITLSINTANFTKNPATGIAVVDWFNGPNTLVAQVYPRGTTGATAVNCQIAANDPTCASPQALVLNNADGWAADITKPSRSAISTNANAGSTYWGGPGTAGVVSATIYAVVYNNNPAFPAGSALNRCNNTNGDGTGCISTVTWSLGPGAMACAAVTQTTLPFTRSFGPAGQTACNYQNTTAQRDNVFISSAIDGSSNPYPIALIPNTVVFGATPDSLRLDYVGPNVVAPTVVGAEGFNWVNASWSFTPSGPKVTDGGVGPVESSWAAFATPNGGGTTFPTPISTGNDLAETNQNCVGAGCDGYLARATANDLLLNASNSSVTSAFGVDKTAPSIRFAFTTGDAGAAACGNAACILASRYNGGGNATVLDSTTYNAIQALPAAGSGDSLRIDAIDNRSGLSREVRTVTRFAQGGTTGTTVTVGSGTCTVTTGTFGAAFIDGWRPGAPQHITCGSTLAGYYTWRFHVVDRAGNTSPFLSTGSATSFRRTLALDPGQPQITGVSPNNNYTGNSPQTWSLGSQDDLEVIDVRLRINYPNLTQGDGAATASGGLVWPFSLSNTFLQSAVGIPSGPFSAGPASGNGTNFNYFSPIGIRFDNSIVNPQVTSITLDQFTLITQETCLGAASPTANCAVNGDPIPAADVPATKPTNLGVQVRDVFGSWSFNSTAGAATGVSAEFVSPILPATVASGTLYTVGYTVIAPGCPQGGGAPGGPCVTSGINWRADGGTGTTRAFRAVQPLSVTLPVFTRVELFGLNAAGEWVFIQRCTVPASVPTSGSISCGPNSTITGSDNGLERYWVFSFTNPVIGGATFTQYRALGVNAGGNGLFSTRTP